MPLLRLVFLLLLAFIAWRAYRLVFAPRPRPPAPPPLQDMVRCAVCEVHLPVTSALRHDGQAFCGEAHKRDYLARHGQG